MELASKHRSLWVALVAVVVVVVCSLPAASAMLNSAAVVKQVRSGLEATTQAAEAIADFWANELLNEDDDKQGYLFNIIESRRVQLSTSDPVPPPSRSLQRHKKAVARQDVDQAQQAAADKKKEIDSKIEELETAFAGMRKEAVSAAKLLTTAVRRCNTHLDEETSLADLIALGDQLMQAHLIMLEKQNVLRITAGMGLNRLIPELVVQLDTSTALLPPTQVALQLVKAHSTVAVQTTQSLYQDLAEGFNAFASALLQLLAPKADEVNALQKEAVKQLTTLEAAVSRHHADLIKNPDSSEEYIAANKAWEAYLREDEDAPQPDDPHAALLDPLEALLERCEDRLGPEDPSSSLLLQMHMLRSFPPAEDWNLEELISPVTAALTAVAQLPTAAQQKRVQAGLQRIGGSGRNAMENARVGLNQELF